MFPCRRTLGRAMHQKARRLALAEAPILFSSVVLCWQNVKICECLLGMPSFQCIGAGSVAAPNQLPDAGPGGAPKGASAWPWRRRQFSFFCRIVLPKQNVNVCLQCPVFNASGVAVAGRTRRAVRRKARRLALAEAPNLFSLSYCVGKTLKSVNVCLQRPVFNASGPAVCRPQSVAGRWAGRRAERRVVWPWRRRRFSFSLSYCVANFKICECLLAMPSFQCIGGGSVPPPMPCRTLGRGGVPKGASGLGGGAKSFFSDCVGK